ncbi:MAG: ABC transporter ATP-binding protein [Parabacteroides sp.]|nr:ABC transporter ATP-binding protein [Parabacteroides sp.]
MLPYLKKQMNELGALSRQNLSLCRLYDPTSGHIYINGVDIKTIPHGEYVRKLGIVLQDFCLFAYSIKENIVFDSEVHEEYLNKIIRKSGLSNKITGLEQGIHTVIYKTLDEGGIEFSGGEGQKVALARAMYKDSSVMILDEPTSTLDSIAENELFSKLSEIVNNKTTLFISHRLSSTRFCNRIFVLENKKISECGSHDELMNQNGIYASLFESQAKYYERNANEV